MSQLLDLSRRPRVAVVSGSYGAGHDAAAREIGRLLVGAGCTVTQHDIATLLPCHLGGLLRRAYFTQLRVAPRSWSRTLERLEPGTRSHAVATGLPVLAARHLLAEVADADLVVSTHPFASQALGHLRRTGRLVAPAVTYLTDASVHALWVAPGVDLHLSMHALAADEARFLGGTSAVVADIVRRTSTGAVRPAAFARRRPYALVVGGSEGVGQLEAAARDIAVTDVLTPVVVCGRNTALQRRLADRPGVVALGWCDDLPGLMRHSACVVQNAGGFSSLEALATGAPVLTYRALPGHGETNAANLERAGLVPWVRHRDALAPALLRALDAPRVDRLVNGAPSLVEALTAPRPAEVAVLAGVS